LELVGCKLAEDHGLHQLTALTHLQELRLAPKSMFTVNRDALSGLQHLTRLELGEGIRFSPGALEGKAKLQHLALEGAYMVALASMEQLLSQLQLLQQLTHLNLARCGHQRGPVLPAASFSALTASSNLHYINITKWVISMGAWKFMFPKGRQLRHLHTMIADAVRYHRSTDNSYPADAPDGVLLASCCPRLAFLQMSGLAYRSVHSNPLQGLHELRGLRELSLLNAQPDSLREQELDLVCQLTSLKVLRLGQGTAIGNKLLRLTQLEQLTYLSYGDRSLAARAAKPVEFCPVSKGCALHGVACKYMIGAGVNTTLQYVTVTATACLLV
jgi:hypothetical protein